jgi:hypothetical protein
VVGGGGPQFHQESCTPSPDTPSLKLRRVDLSPQAGRGKLSKRNDCAYYFSAFAPENSITFFQRSISPRR